MAGEEVFICYSHEDHGWQLRVRTFMEAMKSAREFGFEFFDDEKLRPGEKWEASIATALDQAMVGVLLVSADFMASQFIQESEIPPMRERAERGNLTIVPLLLRPCPWTAMDWLRELQFVNTEPLSACEPHRVEEILTELALEVGQLVQGERTDFDSKAEQKITQDEATRVEDLLEREGFERPAPDGPLMEGTFLTAAGVAKLVHSSPENASSSPVVGVITIFRTTKQRTWFVATNADLFCVLDDAKTSAGRRRLQWRIPLEEADPVRVFPRPERPTGLVDVGRKRNWLYSQRVYPDPDALREAIEALIDTARRT